MGQRHRILAAIVLVCTAFLAISSPAHARAIFAQSCTLAADIPLSVAQASASRQWNCPALRADAKSRYAWLRIPADSIPQGQVNLQSDAMASEGMIIATVDRKGGVHERSYSPNAIARHWIAGTRFSIPLPLTRGDIASIYVRVDKPLGQQVATSLEVVPRAGIAKDSLTTSVLLAFLAGMVAVVAVYSLVMSIAVHSRFAFYNFIGVTMLMIYTISSSSLIFLALPDLTLWQRSIISYGTMACSISLLGPFILNFLEPGMVSPRLRILALLTASLAFSACLLLPLAWATGWSLRAIYHLMFLPGIVVGFVTVWQAWRKGSAAARAFAYAWIVPTLVALERIARAFDLSPLGESADMAFYVSMAGEGIAMSMVIAWRFNGIKRERDEALLRGSELAEAVAKDSLTGLFNRRDFDSRRWRKSDILAIVDLDRFKSVNDKHGHLVGDEVLKAVGTALTQSMEAGQIVRAWRLGGEEFAVAVDAPSIDAAAIVLNVVRERIAAEARSAVPSLRHPITASAGLATIGKNGMRQAYRAADAALYHAKASGRDRLCYDVGSHTMATIFPRPRSGAGAAREAA